MRWQPSDKVLFTTVYTFEGLMAIPIFMFFLLLANVISIDILDYWMIPLILVSLSVFFFGIGLTIMLTRGEPRRKFYYRTKNGKKKPYIDQL